MNPQLATILCLIGIVGLFVLEYDRKARTSAALFLPILWLGFAGSRPLSVWLQMSATGDQLSEGSPFDRAVFSILLFGGMAVLMTRSQVVGRFLKANGPICCFVLYCALSVIWSDYSDIAFKRWTKSLGDFVMILIVLTDRNQKAALKRLLTTLAFVLVPLSVLFIKYFPDLGRQFSPYEGTAYYIGVAEDKNMLGKICLVLGIGLCWRLYEEWFGERRNRVLLAIGVPTVMILWLFYMANSMTSLSCFVFGNILLFALRQPKVIRKRALVHFMVAGMIAFSFAVLFMNVGSFLLEAMGRNPTLTGRTELWGELSAMNVNRLVGTGFESFWLGTRLKHLWSIYWWNPTEAHNGYFEVLLNLGWIGLIFIAAMLVSGYRNILRLLDKDPEGAQIRLAYFVVAIAYNYTESAIRTLDPVWFVLILSVFAIPKVKSRVLPEQRTTTEFFFEEVSV